MSETDLRITCYEQTTILRLTKKIQRFNDIVQKNLFVKKFNIGDKKFFVMSETGCKLIESLVVIIT